MGKEAKDFYSEGRACDTLKRGSRLSADVLHNILHCGIQREFVWVQDGMLAYLHLQIFLKENRLKN